MKLSKQHIGRRVLVQNSQHSDIKSGMRGTITGIREGGYVVQFQSAEATESGVIPKRVTKDLCVWMAPGWLALDKPPCNACMDDNAANCER